MSRVPNRTMSQKLEIKSWHARHIIKHTELTPQPYTISYNVERGKQRNMNKLDFGYVCGSVCINQGYTLYLCIYKPTLALLHSICKCLLHISQPKLPMRFCCLNLQVTAILTDVKQGTLGTNISVLINVFSRPPPNRKDSAFCAHIVVPISMVQR